MKRMIPRLAATALSLLLCAVCLPPDASAYTYLSKEELNKQCSLTLEYHVPGLAFQIYRAADLSEQITFTPVSPFDSYPLRFENLGRDGWTALAATLKGYVARDNIKPLTTGQTDSGGRAAFTGLSTGLYLVLGDSYHDAEGRLLEPAPFLICLPNWVEPEKPEDPDAPKEEGRWVYDATVEPKPSELKTARRVLKVWEDNYQTNRRPDRITVDLLRDGQVYDTVTLSAANNWRWDWKELDKDHVWQVVERSTVSGYTTTVTQAGLTFVITNRMETPPDKPPTNPPVNPPTNPPANPPDDPPEGPPDIPLDDPDVPLTDLPEFPLDDPDVPLDDYVYIDDMDVPLASLPQTGQLWWPVPFLALAGMFLLILGWGWNRRSRFEE